jgi:biopolymer transport protein ExbD
MAFKRKRSEQMIQVPMSSMIDVVFLLLIYFIVTYKEEIPEAHLAVNLPSPSAPPAEPQEPPPLLELEVHPGEYRLRGKTLGLATIQKTLESLAATSPELTVIIKVNQSARTKNLVSVLDVCKGANLSNLNVVTLE